jgi:hypothetical protein
VLSARDLDAFPSKIRGSTGKTATDKIKLKLRKRL